MVSIDQQWFPIRLNMQSKTTKHTLAQVWYSTP